MQSVFFEKKVYAVYNRVQIPRSWGIFENFCVKSINTDCQVTFTCKVQEKMGEQDVLVAPPIILLVAAPALPVSAPIETETETFPCTFPEIETETLIGRDRGIFEILAC